MGSSRKDLEMIKQKTISTKTYHKINNYREKEKAEKRLVYWLHLYIRLRDLTKYDTGEISGRCISCGKKFQVTKFSDGSIMNGREWHAGHLWKSDKHASVRYDPRNINGQCKQCNRQLHGNEAKYQENLIKKIGQKEFDSLTLKKNQIKIYNILEILDLIEEYKQKAKQEAKKKGIKI